MKPWGIILLLAGAALACGAPTLGLTPQPVALATEPVMPAITLTSGPIASLTPAADVALGLSLIEFTTTYDNLTELQRKDFLADLPGKTVDWTGTVYDVDERGVAIEMPGSVWNGMTLLKDVPHDVALTIRKGSRLHFTGTIEKTIQFVFFYVYVVDVVIAP